MIRFHSNIGCSESKVIFKWRKNNNYNNNKKQIKRLYREQMFASRVFHSASLRPLTERHKQTVNKQKSPPWACDKGCAEACVERFSALKTNIDVTQSAPVHREAISETSSWNLRKCSDFDLSFFYKGLGRKIFTQISLEMVLSSVSWR